MRIGTALAATALLVLTACSGSSGPDLTLVDTETAPGSDGVITMTGSDNLRYSSSVLAAPPGEVSFQLTCGGAQRHNLVIEGVADDDVIAACARGETGPVGSVPLEPGVYRYVCTIPGHAITMNGELTVAP